MRWEGVGLLLLLLLLLRRQVRVQRRLGHVLVTTQVLLLRLRLRNGLVSASLHSWDQMILTIRMICAHRVGQRGLIQWVVAAVSTAVVRRGLALWAWVRLIPMTGAETETEEKQNEVKAWRVLARVAERRGVLSPTTTTTTTMVAGAYDYQRLQQHQLQLQLHRHRHATTTESPQSRSTPTPQPHHRLHATPSTHPHSALATQPPLPYQHSISNHTTTLTLVFRQGNCAAMGVQGL